MYIWTEIMKERFWLPVFRMEDRMEYFWYGYDNNLSFAPW